MKLYMHPVSMTSRPVRLFIAENGIAVDEQVVDLMVGEHYQEPFTSINPSRQVPVLEDDGVDKFEKSWQELIDATQGQLDAAKK